MISFLIQLIVRDENVALFSIGLSGQQTSVQVKMRSGLRRVASADGTPPAYIDIQTIFRHSPEYPPTTRYQSFFVDKNTQLMQTYTRARTRPYGLAHTHPTRKHTFIHEQAVVSQKVANTNEFNQNGK